MSNSSKKSLQEKKDDFRDRVQKLKNKLDSTKNSMRQKTMNQRYNQTGTFFGSGLNNYSMVHDGSISPTSLGATSSCGNYQINHVRSNSGMRGDVARKHTPQIVINDLQNTQNLSYYNSQPQRPKGYKLDGAVLLVDRIKHQLRKVFNRLRTF